MRTSTYALAAVATALLVASPRVDALNSAGLAKLGLGEASIATRVQGKGNQSFKGWGGGYGVPETGGQKGGGGGGTSKGGSGGFGGYGGEQKGGAGGGTWEDKKGGGGMSEKQGGGGGTWEDKKGGGGMGGSKQGGGGGTWEKKGGGGGAMGGYGGKGAGGGVWMKEKRRGGYWRGPRYYEGRTYRYRRSPCGWLRRRAVETGSRYWWRRYRACIYD